MKDAPTLNLKPALSTSWDKTLFDEVADLLAEILVLDFQQHPEIMANSPPGFGHN